MGLVASVASAKTPSEKKPKIDKFQLLDVFQLEYANDPQISPDGKRIVYVRTSLDIMSDRSRGNLWIINTNGSNHRPITSGNRSDFSPRWSPDGKKLLYGSTVEGSVQLYLRWMDTGQTAKLTNLTSSPGGVSWSPDGKWIAFSMFVPSRSKPFTTMPAKPKGAKWAGNPKVITKLRYRADGAGYLPDGYRHLFVLSAEGGTPRRLTDGDFNHNGNPQWTPDSKSLIFTSNRRPGWEYDSRNSEIYEIAIADKSIEALTNRKGPDSNPTLSPDGKWIAYTGFDDRLQGYQISKLYLMKRDGSNSRVISGKFDRGIGSLNWKKGKRIYFRYDDKGNTKIAYIEPGGKITTLLSNLGGTTLGRPYTSGSYSVAANGTIAYTESRPGYPADLAVYDPSSGNTRRITRLNEDLLGHKTLAKVEEIWWESSYDKRKIQGWIVKPPGFNPNKTYPLMLEIHGGPFANYGDRFSAEIQLYAAAGYVVLYSNPRGSTSYGEEFGNLIHHNYPGQDYDDLMSGVDTVIAKGYTDTKNLFVTGGSGGGVLTAWIVGHTNRFRAAVSAKPVINWYSFALTSDGYPMFYKYWFPGFPWDYMEHYMKRSPLTYVGHVTTPTMLLTGEVDYRTPMSESEQFYQALKLRKIDTALVRIKGAGHGIASRPSNLIAKVVHILKWFEMHKKKSSTKP